jgi:hypothetical protein
MSLAYLNFYLLQVIQWIPISGEVNPNITYRDCQYINEFARRFLWMKSSVPSIGYLHKREIDLKYNPQRR